MKSFNRIFACLSLALAPVFLVACGGGGGGDVVPTPEVKGSDKLGVVFVQNGQKLLYGTQDGMQTLRLNNAPFQILIPDQKFDYVYLRTSAAPIPRIVYAGNVMGMDPSIENINGWQLKSVVSDDTSMDGFSYDRTTVAGTYRSLNIQAIYQVKGLWERELVGKTSSGPLYFQFYLAGNPDPAISRENIKVILN
jgi:hypothetical protein